MQLELKYQKTKTLNIKENGRSSDWVTPNFIMGCNAGCSNSYCYTRRFGRKYIYINTNVDEILESIRQHSLKLGTKIPNQTDLKYWTYDIGCDTDLNYHWKDYDWDKVLKFFTETPNIKATFATKFVNNQLLPYGNEKLRIRYSLMPQHMSDILEPKTFKIEKRIEAINKFIEHGWDVHINFSPIVYTNTWKKDYEELFKLIDQKVLYKDKVACEVIFLTHNQNLHNINLEQNSIEIENLLWKPEIQETKISQYGGENIRYQWEFKNQLINEFKELHNSIIPWCNIRYIF
jgi:spore photoproduct lyase